MVVRDAPYIPGMPRRWGVSLSRLISSNAAPESRIEKMRIVHEVQSEVERVPLDADESAIYQAAEAAARECYSYVERYKLSNLVVDGISLLCVRMGVNPPAGQTDKEIIARAIDRAWWARKLRKEHMRRFEHTSIRLGFTSMRADPYISREAATRQIAYNRASQRMLESVTVTNGVDDYTLAELAALGVSNKAIRRGELMMRIRGFEEVAGTLRHVGMFWTITCPSKFHSVGGTNPKYNGATPRDAQAYLCKVWARIRAALKRQDIQPYGFRIAEPHSDGCPHWHMLLFVAPEHEEAMTAVIRKHALAEDGNEEGAQSNRVKLVRIEAGKGTAAGYIAKYVSKNIDGFGVGDHKAFEDGRTYIVQTDIFGNEEITASERVTYWSQVWGIRQFQQIGGAPVSVWRELRRVKYETIMNAPDEIKAAWLAGQKIEGSPEIAKQASWADYLKAQGGATVGRGGLIQIATRKTTIQGKYSTYEDERPCGVYSIREMRVGEDGKREIGAIYESVRYQWTRKDSGGGAVAVPWTGVNNCTQIDIKTIDQGLIDSLKNQKICSANVAGWWNGERTESRPDPVDIETYQRHRKNAPAAHLNGLRAKYREHHG